jgi:hypothetical protein
MVRPPRACGGARGDGDLAASHSQEAALSLAATVQSFSWRTEPRFFFLHDRDAVEMATAQLPHRVDLDAIADTWSGVRSRACGIMARVVPSLAPIARCGDFNMLATAFVNVASTIPPGSGAIHILAQKAVGKVKAVVSYPDEERRRIVRPFELADEATARGKAVDYCVELASRVRTGDVVLSAAELRASCAAIVALSGGREDGWNAEMAESFDTLKAARQQQVQMETLEHAPSMR